MDCATVDPQTLVLSHTLTIQPSLAGGTPSIATVTAASFLSLERFILQLPVVLNASLKPSSSSSLRCFLRRDLRAHRFLSQFRSSHGPLLL